MEQGHNRFGNRGAGHLRQARRRAGPPHPTCGAARAGEARGPGARTYWRCLPGLYSCRSALGSLQMKIPSSNVFRDCAGADGGVREDQIRAGMGRLYAAVPGHDPPGEPARPVSSYSALEKKVRADWQPPIRTADGAVRLLRADLQTCATLGALNVHKPDMMASIGAGLLRRSAETISKG